MLGGALRFCGFSSASTHTLCAKSLLFFASVRQLFHLVLVFDFFFFFCCFVYSFSLHSIRSQTQTFPRSLCSMACTTTTPFDQLSKQTTCGAPSWTSCAVFSQTIALVFLPDSANYLPVLLADWKRNLSIVISFLGMLNKKQTKKMRTWFRGLFVVLVVDGEVH